MPLPNFYILIAAADPTLTEDELSQDFFALLAPVFKDASLAMAAIRDAGFWPWWSEVMALLTGGQNGFEIGGLLIERIRQLAPEGTEIREDTCHDFKVDLVASLEAQVLNVTEDRDEGLRLAAVLRQSFSNLDEIFLSHGRVLALRPKPP